MKKNLTYSLIFLSMMGVSSCSNELDPIAPNETKTEVTTKFTTSTPQNLAKSLAKIVHNEAVRNFIKNEALKQKDGDFDILFAEAIDKEIPDEMLRSSNTSTSNTLRNYLLQEQIVTRTNNTSSSVEELLNDIQTNHPLLQISIPNMETADWEEIISGNSPFLVAFLDDNYDDMSGESIVAYDQEGKEHILDGKKAPVEPVIVISESERIISVPRSQQNEYSDHEIMYETSECIYFKKHFLALNAAEESELENNIDSNLSLRATTSYRASHPTYRDYIWKAKLPTSENYESWAKGRPEISVIISFYANRLPNKEIRYDDKGWANNNLRILNSEIIKWEPSELGRYIAYSWREEDGGDKDKTISITFPSGTISDVTLPSSSLSFKVGNKDDIIGTSLVNYDDENGRVYDPTGQNKFNFWLQVR